MGLPILMNVNGFNTSVERDVWFEVSNKLFSKRDTYSIGKRKSKVKE